MRFRFLFVLLCTLVAAAMSKPVTAQQKPAQPVAPAPAKPYKPVAITLPVPLQDQSFAAFRGQLGEIAKKRDRAALGKLVVSQGFFWQRERGETADKRKSGLDNLGVALGLNNSDGAGWDMLAGYAEDPTASPSSGRKDAMCAPADPGFDAKEMDALLTATQTDFGEWGFPVQNNIEVRATAQAGAPVVDKLGLYVVRVLPDSGPVSASHVRIVTPSGKTGYIPSDTLAPIGNDQLCYVKEGDGWRIGGYLGDGDAQ